jgi:hypothetical protein
MNNKKILAALATIGLAAGALMGVAGPAIASQSDDTGHTPVGVCHAKPADTAAQGWNDITVDDDSVVDSAHNTEHSADIIADSASLPGGKNLSAVFFGYTGAEIIANGCALPQAPDPLVATAEVSFVPATCDAPEQLVLGATSNASFGTDTDASALGYDVVATADAGAEFAGGDPTKSFAGTLDDVLDPSDPACEDDEPLVATAEVSFVPATCDAPEQLVLGATSNASFGGDTDASALGYDVVATADAGAEFADGDPATKSFVGTLDDVLDPSDPACAEEEHEKITLCHAKPADTAAQGWVEVEVDDNAVVTSAHFEEHDADIIPISPGVPDGKNLDTVFSGFTGSQILANDCVLPEPGVATATVSFIDATCVVGEKLILGAVSNASWGSATNLTGPQDYSFAATANAGAEFADGDPGDDTKKTFEGSLDGPLPATDPACDLTTLDLVMPEVSSVQPTCTAAGSYTLGAAAGYNPAYVKWTVDGVTDVPSGTYAVTTSRIVTIVAVPVAPHGFEFGWVQPAPIGFTVPGATACDDLPTLAFTGSTSNSDAGLLIAGGLLFMGLAGVYARRRLVSRSE